jgi:hypothetical protein
MRIRASARRAGIVAKEGCMQSLDGKVVFETGAAAWLLPPGDERPCRRRAAEQSDELALFHTQRQGLLLHRPLLCGR